MRAAVAAACADRQPRRTNARTDRFGRSDAGTVSDAAVRHIHRARRRAARGARGRTARFDRTRACAGRVRRRCERSEPLLLCQARAYDLSARQYDQDHDGAVEWDICMNYK